MDLFSPLQYAADFLTYGVLGMQQGSSPASGVNFFLYDTAKIFILLAAINYLMAIVRYVLPVERIKTILTSRRWYGTDYLLAALFGVVTPFCSCSSVPLFIGFVGAGIPLGVTLSFLITSPLVNEASLALFPALFGWQTTILYNMAGVAVGMIGGIVIQKMGMEKYIDRTFLPAGMRKTPAYKTQKITVEKLAALWWRQGWTVTKSILPYVVLGVGVGAVIHGFIPTSLFETYILSRAWWSVPVAALLGVPLYANSVSVLPVMEALIGKGVNLGIVLAFMTATVALSIPEALILKRVMKLPLLATFFAVTTLGIIAIGYLFWFLAA